MIYLERENIILNPEEVAYVTTSPRDPKHSRIHFARGNWLEVESTVGELAELLGTKLVRLVPMHPANLDTPKGGPS